MAVTFVLEFCCCGGVVSVMNTRPNIISDSVKQLTALSERQRQFVKLACQGLSNREIAEELDVTEGTVKCHLHTIYEKLGVRSRSDLIVRFRVAA